MEEKELVKASQSGDEEAFSFLVGKYMKKVFNMALSVTRSHQMADDLTQEIFIKTYYSLPKFRFKSEFGTWLYRTGAGHETVEAMFTTQDCACSGRQPYVDAVLGLLDKSKGENEPTAQGEEADAS